MVVRCDGGDRSRLQSEEVRRGASLSRRIFVEKLMQTVEGNDEAVLPNKEFKTSGYF